MLWPKTEIHTRNLITKKIPAAQKFPTPPPHNFSDGLSLIDKISLRDPQCPAFL